MPVRRFSHSYHPPPPVFPWGCYSRPHILWSFFLGLGGFEESKVFHQVCLSGHRGHVRDCPDLLFPYSLSSPISCPCASVLEPFVPSLGLLPIPLEISWAFLPLFPAVSGCSPCLLVSGARAKTELTAVLPLYLLTRGIRQSWQLHVTYLEWVVMEGSSEACALR